MKDNPKSALHRVGTKRSLRDKYSDQGESFFNLIKIKINLFEHLSTFTVKNSQKIH